MTFVALAADYDGTIAHHGKVDADTVESLKWLKDRGKFLILVTGRQLPELQRIFPELPLFDAVVAENGALLFLPGEGRTESLGAEPPAALVELLRGRSVTPLSVGQSIVATWEPNEGTVLEAVRELGLEWQIIFNKGAVMCLPPGVNKASGLAAALSELKLSPLNVIGVGDAENDHAFLKLCGASAAVANAVPAVIEAAQIALKRDHGAGVRDLIDAWLGKDTPGLPETLTRGAISAAEGASNAAVLLRPDAGAILIAGGSGAGKSHLAVALIERALATGAQLLVLDPEGDYDTLAGVAHLGAPDRAPKPSEAIDLIAEDPDDSAVVNLLGAPLSDRPAFLADILGGLAALRARLGRPHWLLIDEAHHFLPAESDASAVALPQNASGFIFITPDPKGLAAAALDATDTLIAVGPPAPEVLAAFCAHFGVETPTAQAPGDDEFLIWRRGDDAATIVKAAKARHEHDRHVRKYAAGALGADKSFYFRGPENKLNLRARNLIVFLDLADGVDDETWRHHLQAHHYSAWIESAIGDAELAREVRRIEAQNGPADTRALMRAAIERRYTAPG